MERAHLARLDEPPRARRQAAVRLEPRRRDAPGRGGSGDAARRAAARGGPDLARGSHAPRRRAPSITARRRRRCFAPSVRAIPRRWTGWEGRWGACRRSPARGHPARDRPRARARVLGSLPSRPRGRKRTSPRGRWRASGPARRSAMSAPATRCCAGSPPGMSGRADGCARTSRAWPDSTTLRWRAGLRGRRTTGRRARVRLPELAAADRGLEQESQAWQRAREHSESVASAIAAIRAGDAAALRGLLDAEPGLVHAEVGAGGTLLGEVAQPDVFGASLGHALGVDRACVAVLIERGSDLDGPLNLAACFDRVELVEILLAAGARVDAQGITASRHSRPRSTTLRAPRSMSWRRSRSCPTRRGWLPAPAASTGSSASSTPRAG